MTNTLQKLAAITGLILMIASFIFAGMVDTKYMEDVKGTQPDNISTVQIN